MPTSEVDDITSKLEALELDQQQELTALRNKHCCQKKALLDTFAASINSLKKQQHSAGAILSYSELPLRKGDRVILRSTASVGCKGDYATVTHMSPN